MPNPVCMRGGTGEGGG